MTDWKRWGGFGIIGGMALAGLIWATLHFGCPKCPEPEPTPGPVVPDLTLEKEYKIPPGKISPIVAKTKGTACVRFKVLDSGLDLQRRDRTSAWAVAVKSGRYRFTAWTAVDGEPTLPVDSVVIVGDDPGPGPGPDPIPPEPTDALHKAIVAAWKAEADAGKAHNAGLLGSLYRQAALNTVPDAKLTTLFGLFAVMKQASAGLVPVDALPKVRRVIGDELNKTLGTTDKPLDAALRKLAGEQFERIAKGLELCK